VFAIVASALSFGAAISIGACGIFNNIILPVDAGLDVADAQADVPDDVLPPTNSFLTREQAAKFCSNAYSCGTPPVGYGPSIAVSFDLPIYSSNALGSEFSLCMHWVTEVVTPDHVGFVTQRSEMRTIGDLELCPEVALEVPFILDTPPVCIGAEAGTSTCTIGGGAVAYCGLLSGSARCKTPLYLGANCTALGPGAAACISPGTCTPPACENGEIAHYCTPDGGIGGFNCGLFGRGCVVDDAGVPRCTSGGRCTDWTCEGGTLVSCLAGGVTGATFTCPSGTTCQKLPSGGYCEPAPGSVCTPVSGLDHCEGNVLHYCAAGRDATVDCTKVHPGFTCRNLYGTPTCTRL
jgi:hypothetical protein